MKTENQKNNRTDMEYKTCDIQGVWIIEPKVFHDARGYFMESFKQEEFESVVGKVNFLQDNESCSSKGVLRGLHFQRSPYSQAKLVRVIKGKVLDVAVDLRKDSPTFGRYVAVELSDENKRQLFIPRGFAHGFHVLSDEAIFTYKVDNVYRPDQEQSIRYDDPQIAVDWQIAPGEQLCLSEKDTKAPTLKDWMVANRQEDTFRKTYLVTGAAGFIGANFVKYMLQKYADIRIVILDKLTYAGNYKTIADVVDGHRCRFVHGDIGDSSLLDGLFEQYHFDYVVNFAAESHVDRSITDPGLFLRSNVWGTFNLLNAAKKHWTTGKDGQGYPIWREDVRYHQVSTDEVYGSLGETGYFTESTPLAPHSPYSASKAGADQFVMAFSDTYKMPVSITRCSNNYGPYHFPEKLIPLIIKNILEGKQLPVYGDGSNIRDWLYVEDHCKAIDLVLHRGRAGQVYNVGGHNEKSNIQIVKLTIRTIARLMTEHLAYREVLKKQVRGEDGLLSIEWINDSLISFVKDRLGHDQRYAIDPTKIHSELGWEPETSFEVGIEKTIRWYLEHQDWVASILDGSYESYYKKMYLYK